MLLKPDGAEQFSCLRSCCPLQVDQEQQKNLKMRLKIKNAKSAEIVPSTKSYCLDIVIDGVQVHELLMSVDIMAAIDYYGVTELLDIIEERQLNSHLKYLREDDGHLQVTELDLQVPKG